MSLVLQILNHMNAPDYSYGSIMKWAHDASADGYDFCPRGGFDRPKSVDYLMNSVLNDKLLLPYVRTVDLPHGGTTEQPALYDLCFDFVPQLLTLRQNRDITIAKKLAIGIKDPFKPYTNPNGTLDEALSGSVYCEAYNQYITKPASQLFVPIIQWIDRNTIMGNERFSLKPYMFTPAIFKETFWRSIKAWSYHGFLPMKKKSKGDTELGNSIRNFHAELREVLAFYCNATAHLEGEVLPIGPTRKTMKVDIFRNQAFRPFSRCLHGCCSGIEVFSDRDVNCWDWERNINEIFQVVHVDRVDSFVLFFGRLVSADCKSRDKDLRVFFFSTMLCLEHPPPWWRMLFRTGRRGSSRSFRLGL